MEIPNVLKGPTHPGRIPIRLPSRGGIPTPRAQTKPASQDNPKANSSDRFSFSRASRDASASRAPSEGMNHDPRVDSTVKSTGVPLIDI